MPLPVVCRSLTVSLVRVKHLLRSICPLVIVRCRVPRVVPPLGLSVSILPVWSMTLSKSLPIPATIPRTSFVPFVPPLVRLCRNLI